MGYDHGEKRYGGGPIILADSNLVKDGIERVIYGHAGEAPRGG